MPQTQAVSDQDLEMMDLTQLGSMKQADGKHAGKTLLEATSDEKYILWLTDYHDKNPKFKALLTYARRIETQKEPQEVKAPVQTKAMHTVKSSTKSDGSLMTSSTSEKFQRDQDRDSEDHQLRGSRHEGDDASLHHRNVKSQMRNLAAHNHQIQEAAMVIHQHMLQQQEEMNKMANRLTQLEAEAETIPQDFNFLR
jgi:hypothetical protein